MSDQPKIVFATDVRFWHQKTGAQRRIHSLVQYLMRSGFDVTTLFVSPLANESNGRTASSERKAIQQSGLEVVSLLDDWKPQGLIARGIWECKCIANWIASGIRQRSINARNPPSARGKYLSDFESPLFRERFQQMVQRIDPDVVVVEYVTLGYLVPEKRVASKPRYFIDTHDLLYERFRQFQKHGYEHWIRISRDEEADVLRKFDTIIAIQGDELTEFEAMTGHVKDIVFAGHPGDIDNPATVDETLNAKYLLGYFASDNASNTQAIEWFVKEVWRDLIQLRPAATLLIAGSVCHSICESVRSTPGITFRESIIDLDELYRSFQLSINPVQFGTGLKIKNQEALAYGKPLVVTKSGIAGMLPSSGFSPVHAVDDAAEMKTKILELTDNEALIRRSAEAALRYAKEKLSPDLVYESLMNRLRYLDVESG